MAPATTARNGPARLKCLAGYLARRQAGEQDEQRLKQIEQGGRPRLPKPTSFPALQQRVRQKSWESEWRRGMTPQNYDERVHYRFPSTGLSCGVSRIGALPASGDAPVYKERNVVDTKSALRTDSNPIGVARAFTSASFAAHPYHRQPSAGLDLTRFGTDAQNFSTSTTSPEPVYRSRRGESLRGDAIVEKYSRVLPARSTPDEPRHGAPQIERRVGCMRVQPLYLRGLYRLITTARTTVYDAITT